MKHIKLFESFTQDPFLIGLINDGNQPEAPVILTKSRLEELKFHKYGEAWSRGFPDEPGYAYFDVYDESPTLPEALLCSNYSGEYNLSIKGISRSMAQRAMEMIGGDVIDNMEDGGDAEILSSVAKMVGVDPGVAFIAIIPDPEPNTVYLGDDDIYYWNGGYTPTPVEEFIGPMDVEETDQYVALHYKAIFYSTSFSKDDELVPGKKLPEEKRTQDFLTAVPPSLVEEIVKKLPKSKEEALKMVFALSKEDEEQLKKSGKSTYFDFSQYSPLWKNRLFLYLDIYPKSKELKTVIKAKDLEIYSGITPADIRKMSPKQVYYLVFYNTILN